MECGIQSGQRTQLTCFKQPPSCKSRKLDGHDIWNLVSWMKQAPSSTNVHTFDSTKLTTKLKTIDGVLLEGPNSYGQVAESLVCPTITRLDVAYIVHIVSQFTLKPKSKPTWWVTVLHILHYLQATENPSLFLSSNGNPHLRSSFFTEWAGGVNNSSLLLESVFLWGILLSLTKVRNKLLFPFLWWG